MTTRGKPGEEITTVHNTDHDGIARIEKIAERKRTLFINDGKGLRLFQRLVLEPGKLSKITFVLPYNSLITARRPPGSASLRYTVSALRLGKEDFDLRYNEGCYPGEVRGNMLSARVPAGRFVLLVEPYDPKNSPRVMKRFLSPPVDIGASETRAVSLSPEK